MFLKKAHEVLDVFFNVLEKCSRCFRCFFLKVFEGCHQSRGRHISSWSPLNWEWGRFLNRFCSKSERHRNHSLLQVNKFRQNSSQEGNIRYLHFILFFFGVVGGVGRSPSLFSKTKNIYQGMQDLLHFYLFHVPSWYTSSIPFDPGLGKTRTMSICYWHIIIFTCFREYILGSCFVYFHAFFPACHLTLGKTRMIPHVASRLNPPPPATPVSQVQLVPSGLWKILYIFAPKRTFVIDIFGNDRNWFSAHLPPITVPRRSRRGRGRMRSLPGKKVRDGHDGDGHDGK